MTHKIGSIKQILRFPVKSMGGEFLDEKALRYDRVNVFLKNNIPKNIKFFYGEIFRVIRQSRVI